MKIAPRHRKSTRSNDGRTDRTFNRRALLEWGSLGCLGISLPGLFKAKAAQGAIDGATPLARIKACIVIFYYGGPSHLDMFDMKPDAPAEVRGEFASIETSVPGLRISEHLPHTARVMHKVALIRSMHHEMRLHDAACVATLTGRPPARGDGEFFAPPDQSTLLPSVGASFSYLIRDSGVSVPHAALPFVINNVVPVPCQTGGILGTAWNPFQIHGDPDTLAYHAETLRLPEGLSLARVARRANLLETVRSAEGGPTSEGTASLAAHYQKAFDLLASEAVRRALDVAQESEPVRRRYGMGEVGQSFQDGPGGDNGAHLGIGRNLRGQNLLLARRLVEAGVPFVNVFDFKQQGKNWDAHTQNFSQHKDHLLPPSDRAFAALIEDLDERGLLDSTLVVALGEFGRTPRINASAGRDHWPDCYSALVAGGGVRGGYVHGASDKIGAYPDRDPVTPGDLAATIFSSFGIDPAAEIRDSFGRPFKVAEGRAVRALFG